MRKIQILLGMLFSSIWVHAQTAECGTVFTPAEYNNYFRTHRQQVVANRTSNNDVLYFPIQYHIFRESSGTMALPSSETQIMTKRLNSAYKNANIHFYTCSYVDVITNDNYFDFSESLETQLAQYDNPNAINVYICNSINYDGINVAGYSHFPWEGVNRIFIAKDYANSSTVPHEFGHYFGLLHTHETYYGRELIDGSNCETAGDLLCDTPADPGLSNSTVDCDCNYIGNEYLYGLPYSPNTKNLMSYSRKECRTKFSDGQNAVIRHHAQTERYYLVDTKVITDRIITGSETYINDIAKIDNTVIKSGGSLVIDFCNFSTIDGPFEVELGAFLEIK